MRNFAIAPVRLVLVLWLAGLGAAAQFAKISIILPELRQTYPEATLSLGFMVSLLSVIGIFLGLFAGLIATRIGFRKILLYALVSGSVISAFQATMPTISLFLVSRVFEGFSHLGIVIAAPTLIAQISAKRYQPLAMTLWGTFFGVAFALVAWFGTPLVSHYGPAGLFLAHSLILFLTTLLLLIWLPKDLPETGDLPTMTLPLALKQHYLVYASPTIAAPALGWLFYTITFVSLLTILPDTVAPENRSLVGGLMPLASIASSMTLGVLLLKYMSAVQQIIIGFLLAMIVALILLLVPGQPILCIALFACLGLVQGASFAAIPQLNRQRNNQAYANGALAQMGNMGNACGTPLLLSLLIYLNYSALIIAIITCYVLGIGIHLYLARLRAAKPA